ncbi:MAG TPA: lipid-A-disaccharide synthase [Bacteroidetes bacterium]|nr:lipid-A-disaccharide synthase [Bacteroidota bacterium]
MTGDNILIVAGEPSGDIHAAPVVHQLKRLNPGVSFWGTGGRLMRDAGVELLADIDDLAVMGFSDIPRLLPTLARLRKTIIRQIRARKTLLAVLVDYPGFNLNLARALKRLATPPQVLQYIAPQVWAWRANRIRKMRGAIDRLAVVFPFEVNIFQAEGIRVDFVGHPLLDELEGSLRKEVAPKPPMTPLLALLPGSRVQEVSRHLPVMTRAAELMRRELPELKVGVSRAPGLEESLYHAYLGSGDRIRLYSDSHELLADAAVAAVCSGTATLETALLGIPQVVVYRTSPLNYRIARSFIRLDNIALVNVVAGKRIVTELIQQDLKPERLAGELLTLIGDAGRRAEISESYRTVGGKLGKPGAAGRVAAIISEMMTTGKND